MTGCIPVLLVEGEGLAEAWEKSLISLYENGCDIKTEYDKPGDPPSKDSTMTIVVRNPLAEPMIHKDFPGGLEDLQEYVLEVVEGIKDHLVRAGADDSENTKWEYTYHQRLMGYEVPGVQTVYDQIDLVAEKLAKTPHTRRAQAITWKVWDDNFCYDPPCLQSIWCRLLQDQGGKWRLNTNVRFRSNDAQSCVHEHVRTRPASARDSCKDFENLRRGGPVGPVRSLSRQLSHLWFVLQRVREQVHKGAQHKNVRRALFQI